MNTHHLLIETLTPLHVGSGRMLQGNTEYLYFSDSSTVVVVNERRVLEIIGEENIDAWLSIIGRGDDLLDYLRKRKPGIQPADAARRLMPVLGAKAPGNSQTIREHIFSGNGQPILPGSSLKGSIRTAVLNQVIRENPVAARRIKEYKTEQHGRVKYKGATLEKTYFGPDPNHDTFRLLRIGDAHFDQTVCLLSETLNERGSGFEMKESVRQFIECIPAGAETLCRVQIPAELKTLLNQPRYQETAAKLKQRDRIEWPRLLADVNAQTKRLINDEIDRYQRENLPKGASRYVEQLNELLHGIHLKPNQCIIRVGFGTGYLNMTGGWPLEQWRNVPSIDYAKEMDDLAEGVRRTGKYNGLALPKSRKMALDGVPLGFLKLTLLNEAGLLDYRAGVAERVARHIKQAEDARLADQQKQSQLEAKEQAKQEADRLAEEERRKPVYLGRKPKRGDTLDALVTETGKRIKMKLYITDSDMPVIDLGYPDIPVGTVIEVTVKDVSGRGQVMAVGFKQIKRSIG